MESIADEIDALLGEPMIDVDFSYLNRDEPVYQSLPPPGPRGRGNGPSMRYEPKRQMAEGNQNHLFKNFSSVVNDDADSSFEQGEWYATPPPDVKRFSIDVNAVATFPRKLRVSEVPQGHDSEVKNRVFRRTTVQSLADLLARTTKHEHQQKRNPPGSTTVNRKSVSHIPQYMHKPREPEETTHFRAREQLRGQVPYQGAARSRYSSGEQFKDHLPDYRQQDRAEHRKTSNGRHSYHPQADYSDYAFNGYEQSFDFNSNPGYRRIGPNERYDFLEKMNKERQRREASSGSGYEPQPRWDPHWESEEQCYRTSPPRERRRSDRYSYDQTLSNPNERYPECFDDYRRSRQPEDWEYERDRQQSQRALGVQRMKRYSYGVPESYQREFSGQSGYHDAMDRHDMSETWNPRGREKRMSFFDIPVEPLRISRAPRPVSVYDRYHEMASTSEEGSGLSTPLHADRGYRTSRFSSSSARDFNQSKRQSYTGFTAKNIQRSERVVCPSDSFNFTPAAEPPVREQRPQRHDHVSKPRGSESRRGPLASIQNDTWDYKSERGSVREYPREAPRRWNSKLRVRRHCYGYAADQLAAIPEPEEDDSDFSLLHTPPILLKKTKVPEKHVPKLPVLVEKPSTGTSPFAGVRVTRRTMAPVPHCK